MKTLRIHCVVDSVSRITKDNNLFGWKVCLRQCGADQPEGLRGNIYPTFHSVEPPMTVNSLVTVVFKETVNV